MFDIVCKEQDQWSGSSEQMGRNKEIGDGAELQPDAWYLC